MIEIDWPIEYQIILLLVLLGVAYLISRYHSDFLTTRAPEEPVETQTPRRLTNPYYGAVIQLQGKRYN